VRAEGGYDREVRAVAEREMDDLVERLGDLGVGGDGEGVDGDADADAIEGGFDRPWREDE